MRSGIQTIMAEAGEAACLALCLVKIAEKFLMQELEPFSCLLMGIDKKFIHYNEKDQNDNNNFYVDQPALFLEAMTRKKWTYRHEVAGYIPKPTGEYTIQRWERVRPQGTTNHFRLRDWDPLADSQTVRYGKIVSERVCRVED